MRTSPPVLAGTPAYPLETVGSPGGERLSGRTAEHAGQTEPRPISTEQGKADEAAHLSPERNKGGSTSQGAHSASLMPAPLRGLQRSDRSVAFTTPQHSGIAAPQTPEEWERDRQIIFSIISGRLECARETGRKEKAVEKPSVDAEVPLLSDTDTVLTPNGTDLKPAIKNYIWVTANTKSDYTCEEIARRIPNLEVIQVEQFLKCEERKFKQKILDLSRQGVAPTSLASQMPGVPLSKISQYLDELIQERSKYNKRDQ